MKPTSTISRAVQLGIHIIGMWPGTPFAGLYKFLWFSSLVLCQTFQFWHLISHFGSDDIFSLVDNLCAILPFSLLFFKLVSFWINKREFFSILRSMARDWYDYALVDSMIMIKTAYLSHRFSHAIIGLYSTTVILYGVGVLVSLNSNKQGNATSRDLLLKMELPFECSTSPIYELVMLTQFLHQLASATTAGIVNALLVTMVLHVGGQIDIICETLINTTFNTDEQLKCLIDRHQRIISFTKNMENIFTYIALMQFLSNTLIICCLGFIIMISIGTEDATAVLTKCLLFYASIATEAFMLCFAGEYLTNKGKMIGNAAYGSTWYQSPPKNSKLLLLLVLRSQKALSISIGKFTNLSLESFAIIVKASASYASVLLAMY